MIAIIGAGLSGLTTALFLKKGYRIFEKENCPGGLSRTLKYDNSYCDFGGHWLHIRHDWVKKLVTEDLGISLNSHGRDARISLDGVFGAYPFQNNLGCYAPETIYDCIMGLIEAKYGPRHQPADFAEYINMAMGTGIGKHFMVPYNTKLWGTPPEKMSTDWMGRFVPVPDVEKALKSIIFPTSKNREGYNQTFFYPDKGGIGILPVKLAEAVKNIDYNAEVVEIDYKRKVLVLKDGARVRYDRLVSTMPLVELLSKMKSLPDRIIAAGEKLNWTDIIVYNLTVKGRTKRYNWIYFPDKRLPFFRMGNYTTVKRSFAPRGMQSLYVEVSQRLDRKPSLPSANDILEGLKAVDVVARDAEIVSHLITPLRYSYVIYDHNRQDSVSVIQKFLRDHNIYSIGRYGAWEYSSMEDAMSEGKTCAKELMQ